jgi:hypothetical protein
MILEIVAIVLICLITLIAAFLLIPFQLNFETTGSLSSVKVNVKLSWLGITLWRNKPSKQEEKKKQSKKKEKVDASRFIQMASAFREAIPSLAIIVRSARKAISFRMLHADFAFGLGDPVDTATLAGYLWSFVWAFNQIPKVSLSFLPDFKRLRLDGTLKADASVRMFYVVSGFLRACSKKPFRKFIREVRR